MRKCAYAKRYNVAMQSIPPYTPENIQQFKLAIKYEYWTLLWNALSVVVLSYALSMLPSAALLGMSLVCGLHVFSSVVVLAQLNGIDKHREHLALKVIALFYFVLTVYMAGRCVISFASGKHYMDTMVGIFWLGLSYFVLLSLSRMKRTVGHALQNQTLIHVAQMNLVDSYIILAVIGGLILSTFAQFYWADPAVALIIVGYACEEGIAAWRASVEHGKLAQADAKNLVERAKASENADDSVIH